MRDVLQRLDVAECPGDVNYKCRCVENDGLVRAYEIGVQDSMLRATQYERILRDLIAEIKEEFIELPDGATESCVHPCVYRAEARLRALQTPGGPAGADLKEGEGSGDA